MSNKQEINPVQAKKLIKTYETGEAYQLRQEEIDDFKAQYPEISFKELAQPGTTKKRMMELEKRQREAELELQEGKYSSATKELSPEQYGEFADDRMQMAKVVPKDAQGGVNGDKNGVGQEVVQEKEIGESNWKEENKGMRRVMIVVAAAPVGKNLPAVDKTIVVQAVKTFQKGNNEVIVLDLSRIRNEPVDFKAEKDKVMKADLIMFHYRSVLHNVPARLLEWFQNVVVDKAAFTSNKIFNDGPLKGKRSFLSVTLARDKSAFAKGSPHGDIAQYLWPIENGILRFIGLSVLNPLVVYGAAPGAPAKITDEAVSQLNAKLAKVWDEKPV